MHLLHSRRRCLSFVIAGQEKWPRFTTHLRLFLVILVLFYLNATRKVESRQQTEQTARSAPR